MALAKPKQETRIKLCGKQLPRVSHDQVILVQHSTVTCFAVRMLSQACICGRSPIGSQQSVLRMGLWTQVAGSSLRILHLCFPGYWPAVLFVYFFFRHVFVWGHYQSTTDLTYRI